MTELRAREFRAAVSAEDMNALAGRSHGLPDEHRKGVHREGLVLNEPHLLPLGLLVNELDRAFEPAQRFRRKGAQGVDGYELERAYNILRGLLGVRLLCALSGWTGTIVLKVAGVVDTANRLLLRDVKSLVVHVSHAPVPQLSGFRL